MRKEEWILPYMKQNARLFVLVIFLGAVTIFSAAFLMFTSGFLISKSAARPENILLVYVPIVAVRTFGIARSVSRYAERLTGHHIILKIVSDMRVRLYNMLEPASLMLSSRFRTGDMLGILAEDIEHLQDAFLKTIFPAVSALLLYAASVIGLGFFSWPFAAFAAIYLFILVVLFPVVSLLVTRAKNMRLKSGRNTLYSRLTDAVLGVSDWMFSGRQAAFISSYEEKEKAWFDLESKRQRFTRWRDLAAQCLVGGFILIMLFWTAGQYADGSIANTMIAAFVLVVFPLTEAFLPLSDALTEVPSYQDSIKRMSKAAPELRSREVNQTDEKLDVSDVTLTFDNVTFSYDQHSHVLDRFSFTLRQGEKMALLGRSGSGKSTSLALIEGALVPDSGKVMLNGLETAAVQEQISSAVAVLNQKPHLFNTSIMNNIRLGNGKASDEDVKRAARQVKLHDYIESLPDGYETSVQETGIRFSGGERQRIALARILLQDTPVIILDEPTVGLDAVTERELLDTIFDVFKEKTILWITHHLAGVETADKIVFLENGKAEMEGTHQELLAENERYRKLYRLDVPIRT
ncbi:thiol reductant ABC exporter subunit CydC [Bacillus velezensis]|uniref:thiol reductant ABC exporter subunit CydC n=1 Tax=Bacillus velezensis TaxID=492670 RepID=UPI000624A6BD|nr:thiol reductant ABC exporter subunit CydC [Bacillus velezensis]AKF74849.1 ATP-binding protein [Bacillus velezensis]UVF87606.1 thiol reductant ABC exporter subunit CydC [Bacillus velezensis]